MCPTFTPVSRLVSTSHVARRVCDRQNANVQALPALSIDRLIA